MQCSKKTTSWKLVYNFKTMSASLSEWSCRIHARAPQRADSLQLIFRWPSTESLCFRTFPHKSAWFSLLHIMTGWHCERVLSITVRAYIHACSDTLNNTQTVRLNIRLCNWKISLFSEAQLRINQRGDTERNRSAAVIIIYPSEQSNLHIKYCQVFFQIHSRVNGKGV